MNLSTSVPEGAENKTNRIWKYSGAAGWLVLLIWAIFIATQLFHAAKTANSEFYQRWPLQGDTVSYWVRDIALTSGPLDHRIQALNGAMLNGRDPARTAFYAFLPSGAPISVNGHLPFSAISAFIFLFMLMILIRRRTGSFTYAIGASLIPLLPKGLMNTMYGLPSKLPDLPASFLFGASLFAIFSGKNSRKSELIWTFIAGLLLGVATLSRYQVWIYGTFIIGPIAFAFGLKRYFNDGRRILDVVIFPAVFIAGLGIIAGYFIVNNLHDTYIHYATVGYALGTTILTSLQTTGAQFLRYLGIPVVLAAALTMAAFISIRYEIWPKTSKWDTIAIGWALIAYPILLFFVMRVESIVEQTYYIIPGIMIFFIAPFSGETDKNNVSFKVFSICLVLIIPLAVFGNVYGYLKSETFLYPRPQEMEIAKFQHDVGELVAVNIPFGESKRLSTIDSNFSYYGRFVEPLVKIKYNRDSKSLQLFQIRHGQWKEGYTGDETTDKVRIIKDLNEKVDIFIALTKPLPDKIAETFVDDYTERMAYHVNSELAANPDRWEKKGVIASPYGEVTVYKNRKRDQ